MDAVLTCLVSDSIGPGVLSHQLASDLAAYLGVEAGTCVRDYSTAIGLAFDAAGIAAGDQVILSPLAPGVYRKVLASRGVRARLVDVDPASGSLTAKAVQESGILGVKAIIVHYTVGIIPEIEALSGLGLPMIEDISEGFGGITADKRSGTYGQFTIVGLEPEHIVTAGGGAVVLARGKHEKAELKQASERLPREMILSDMNAALAIQQVKRVEQFIEKRREIAAIYHRAIMRGRHKMLIQPGETDSVYFSFAVVLANGAREVIQYARRKQVETVRAFESSYLAAMLVEMSADPVADESKAEEQIADVDSGSASDQTPGPAERLVQPETGEGTDRVTEETASRHFPNAQSLYLRCVLFPLYPSLPRKEVEKIERVLTTLP